MSDEIPSPAAPRQRADERAPSAPPFAQALFDALRAQLVRVERENAELHVAVAQLNARLRKANEARERWQLRQQAWHRERDELLARLDGRRR